MKWYAEMRLLGSGPLSDDRFDALADALAEIDEADPAIEDADLTASMAAGWVTASLVVDADGPEDAVRKVIATIRAAIHQVGDLTPGWERLTDTPSLTIRPANGRQGTAPVAV